MWAGTCSWTGSRVTLGRCTTLLTGSRFRKPASCLGSPALHSSRWPAPPHSSRRAAPPLSPNYGSGAAPGHLNAAPLL